MLFFLFYKCITYDHYHFRKNNLRDVLYMTFGVGIFWNIHKKQHNDRNPTIRYKCRLI